MSIRNTNEPDRSKRTSVVTLAGGALGGLALLIPARTHAGLGDVSSVRTLPAGNTIDLRKKGMQLVITGSGSALPDPLRGGASCAVAIDGEILQFDCGRRVLDNLMLVGINPVDVDYLFFTHLHFDHIADYDYYLISNWLAGRQRLVGVFGPKGTTAMSNGALTGMHQTDYRFVKSILEHWPPAMKQRPASEPPFAVKDIGAGVSLETDRCKVSCVHTRHLPDPSMYSLGYRIDSDYGSIVISGDTAPSDNIRMLAKDVDLLVHECVKPDLGMTHGGKFDLKDFHDKTLMEKRPQTGHTSPTELGRLASEANVKKLVAYHLPPYTSVAAAIAMSSLYYGPTPPGPEIWSAFVAAIEKNYRGPVVLAEDRMIFAIGV